MTRPAAHRRRPPPRGFGDPSEVLWPLIGANIAVFVAWHLSTGTLFAPLLRSHLVLDPRTVLFAPWTLLTYAFTHYDTSHLLFNLFGLWIFGGPVAERYGNRALLIVYVLGAISAAVAHLLLSASPALGASGSVLALAMLFGLSFPERTLLLWFFLPMSARTAAFLFVALDVIGLIGPSDGVAHAAHLGGAAFGAGYWWWARRR